MTTPGVFSRGTLVAAYKGLSTLLHWIAVAGREEYAAYEKSIVDEFVEKNDHVVDLEMALPAWARRRIFLDSICPRLPPPFPPELPYHRVFRPTDGLQVLL
jgi:hypothetical protein